MSSSVGIEPGFYSFDDFVSLPYDEQPWLIKPLVPAGGWVNIYGQPKKARKSYLALGLTEAVANEKRHQWLGFDVARHGLALYFQVDTPHNLWRQRVLDVSKGGYDFSNVWFASMATIKYPFNIAEHEDWLAESIAAVPETPALIVYDTARKMHHMNENSSDEMTMFMASLERVSGIEPAKVLISHDKKGPSEGDQDNNDGNEHEREGGDLMKGNRGSSAVAGAVDTIIKMTPKGYMYYQGRAVGEEHKKLKFDHVHGDMGYVWSEAIDPVTAEARLLLTRYKHGTAHALGRMLAKKFNLNEESARTMIRRMKEKNR